jgi:protein-tyrosine phosphatase
MSDFAGLLRALLVSALAMSMPSCARSEAATGPDAGEPTSASVGGVDITGAFNVREVGGIPTRDGRRVRHGALFRSGHLAMVNEQGYAQFVKLGIVSVVDLRSQEEVKAAPDAPWVMSGTRHMVADCPKLTSPSQDSYLQALQAAEPKLARLFGFLGAPKALPALLHCGMGRDRACLGMSLVLLALGVVPERVAADFAVNQAMTVDSRWLDGVFARIAAQGGIDAYLAGHGVAHADLDSLRAQALE